MNFTQNNHLTYTIGDRLFGHRDTPYEKYKVHVGKIDIDYYKTSNWLEEQYRTADMVSKEFGKDLVVMFSGGTDSEIVLRSFLKIGVKPRAVFIKFKDDYNWNDYLNGLVICNELGIMMETIEFDVKEFYKSGEAAEFATVLQCRQIAYLTVYHNILKLQAPAVMGGEMLLRRHVTPTDSKWYYTFRENEDASAMRFSMKYTIPLVNEWFSYTPEMIGYYLENTGIQQLITERYNYKLASVSSKNEILYKLMPELVRKNKTTGYEKLLGFNGETYRELYLTHPSRLESSLDGIFIDDLKIQLYGKNYDSSKT
jgi:predicted PP-loop superfamily ATPase